MCIESYFYTLFSCTFVLLEMGLDARKPVLGVANSNGADQPAHQRSLVSAFVICLSKVSYLDLLGSYSLTIFARSQIKIF